MKKLILLLVLLNFSLGLSQPITVSTSTYTVPQLVNNVLINSPCVNATNITWRTGTNFGSSNGIGFFQNSNPNFPMQSGVVLSTGNALNTPGPNTSLLNDGSTAWTGDTSLEATLAAAGIPMTSTNATVLEFDFLPISSNFSFDFVFASEEYGNFQCQYSDAFAFLLTNMNTGVTTNLAVVPNTTTPISVVTIRDFVYNSSCPSANAQFFGSFNGGSNANNAAINFNGQTKLLTAASVLTPNVPYHIKLVIADRLDPQSDSSIYISSNSFNIGQNVLGLDLTVANSTAICYGSTHLLETGLNPSEYTFVWKKNGVVINGQTEPSLNVTQTGTYSVTYTSIFSSCEPFTDEVLIEFYPQISSPNPNNLYKCDIGAASYTFDLSANTTRVKQGLDPATTVTYHSSQSDANNNINPLPLQYESAGNQTIYVRIQLPNSLCFRVKSFQLLLSPPPVANQAPDLVKCEKSYGSNNANFDLRPQSPIILNGQSANIYTVKYYTSLNDANNATNPLSNGNVANGLYTNTTIYVRVYNTNDPSCFSITSFNLIVNPIPNVDVLENVIVCDSYTLQPLVNGNYFTEPNGEGTQMFSGDILTETQTIYIFNQPNGPNTCSASSSFTVTIVDVDQLTPEDITSCNSYTLNQPTYGKYYTQPGGNGSEIPSGTVITSNQTIYYYFTTTIDPICVVDTSFNVTIVPGLDVGDRNDVFECSSYTLPSLSVGNYFSGPSGTGNQLSPGTVITSTQTIYVFATTSGTTPCSDEDEFKVVIGMPQPANIDQCNGYTLPQLPIGNYFTGPMGTGQQIPAGTVINNNSTIYVYAPTTSGGANCTDNMFFTLTFAQPQIDSLNDISVCESYTLPTLTNGEYFTEPDGNGTMLYAGDVIISTQTIYIFKRLNASCANENSFTVTVIGLPEIDSRSDIDICDQYVLTPLSVGNYYTGPNGTGTLLPAGTVITTSQRIYIYAISNTTPACSAQNSFDINIFSTSADQPDNVTACDSYILPSLTENNKYYTLTGGPNGSGVELLPGTAITTSQTIYVFKESEIRTAFSCLDENSFTVTINNTPVVAPISNVTACNNYQLPVLTVGDYYTGPNGSGTLLNAGSQITSPQTLYVYAHTNTTPDCSSQQSFSVNVFNVDELPNITICVNYTLPVLNVGKYYTGPNGTGTILNPGTVLNTSQTIYIFGQSNFNPSCSDESSFVVTIVPAPLANAVPVSSRTVCDEDGTNDGITSFNLTNLNSIVLGTQTGSEFTINYYLSLSDALAQTNSVTSTTATTVYVRVNNTLAPSCYDIKSFTIIVNKLPEPTPRDGFVCIDNETGTLLNSYTMYSGLSNAGHSFIWRNESGQIVSTYSAYTATAPGTYTLVATNNTTGCTSEVKQVVVQQSEPAEITYEVEDDFSSHQNIIVTATGVGGDYEYQLDGGLFQDSNIFENVTSGLHTITVRDKNGCGITTLEAIVINYPKFFTPNGDGYNDTWNITDLSNQSTAIITIYDRYGKVLKQIKPSGQGWDGTYNGKLLFSDDYWFAVSYTDENLIPREFKAHFSMKR
ncbi:T9SS type B sorting domain-containing protein [Flavobacterium capsici]|uniref:Choice-of-anchor L domain-containing protein n=1 Tax=Flavobacterium capsici TaxID=3075618 RepID=A0AA96EW01_9FLAO|nr:MULTISPECIES: choice-of-anchor L domain-containing protein [unclassified Flavobacterium]WNM18967.1 choice-of-anchor L domain-containing protein [Flavobacterium sp. PMR2A8]WNM23017.1 choice-of-anchor L domain-containing protein [Flavobacterium sp. PMTSA4]